MRKVQHIGAVMLVTMASGLSGCAVFMGSAGVDWPSQDPGPVPDHADGKVQAAQVMRARLKDPDSAQFRNWTPWFKMLHKYGVAGANNPDPLWTICAEVNGKNAFGGYAGYQWMFVKFRDGQVVKDDMGVGQGDYDCTKGPANPARVAPEV